MHAKDILLDGYGRVREEVHAVLDGIDPAHLNARPDPDANSLAWLVWHLTRVQDDHLADAFGLDQVWLTGGWYERLALGLPPRDHGYGHTSAQVAQVRVTDAALLTGYFDAVHAQSTAALSRVTANDLERVVDTRWDPPVTLGVRLVSVLADDLQHVGQAAYVRGLLERGATGKA